MTLTAVYRTDPTNVGDWYCNPTRYFLLGDVAEMDISDLKPERFATHVIVGGGGLIAKNFHPRMESLCSFRSQFASLVAWGIGESENVSKHGVFMLPFDGPMPDYLKAFDLVGVRDFGTEYRWVPCASCMHAQFDQPFESKTEFVIYEHKRVPIPIDAPFPRRSNDGNDIDATVAFLRSAETVITNSYHGAYWATLLGKRVIGIANMSKMYRFRHMPVICRPQVWKRYVDRTQSYPNALAECRQANIEFYEDVKNLIASKTAAS